LIFTVFIVKNQTAIEYLIILAVVIIIALIVVGTFGGITAIGGAGDDSSSKAVLSVSEIGVLDYAGTSNGTLILLQNNKPFSIELVAVSFSGINCSNATMPVIIGIGAKQQLFCPNIAPTADKFSYVLQIFYRDITSGMTYTITLGTIKGRISTINSVVPFNASAFNRSLYLVSNIAEYGLLNVTLYNPWPISYSLQNISVTWGDCFVLNESYPLTISSSQTRTLRLDCINVSNQTMSTNPAVLSRSYSIPLSLQFSNGSFEQLTLINTTPFVKPKRPLRSDQYMDFASIDNLSIQFILIDSQLQCVFTSDNGHSWLRFNAPITSHKALALNQNASMQTLVTKNETLYVSTTFPPSFVSRGPVKNWTDVVMNTSGHLQLATAYDDFIYRSVDSGTSWSPVGFSLNWSSIAMNPSGSIIVAVANSSYIYLSNDSGLSWVNRSSIQFWSSVSVDSSGRYITAGTMNGSLFVSNDYGNSFLQIGLNQSWKSISMSHSGQYQLAVSSLGFIYVSSNFGSVWNQISINRSWKATFVESSGQQMIALSTIPYYSNDYGLTWVNVSSPKALSTIDVSSDGKFVTLSSTGDSTYRSSDGGNTFSRVGSWGHYYHVALSDSGQYQLMAINYGSKLRISSDFGQTWSETGSALDWNRVAINGNGSVQVASSSSSIYISTNYGVNWSASNLSGSFHGIAITSEGPIIYVVSDNGPLYRSTNLGLNWSVVLSNVSDINDLVVTSDDRYLSFVGRPSSIRYYNISSGNLSFFKEGWKYRNGISISDTGKFILSGPDGFYPLEVSQNYGQTWFEPPHNSTWNDFAMSHSGLRQFAVSDPGELYISHDGGIIWRPVNP
jgi:photosystem II stability/assembly factor-like uncharacterized protein